MTKNKDTKINMDTGPFSFNSPFLGSFHAKRDELIINAESLDDADALLNEYQKDEIDWQLEEYLHKDNKMLASFAISKAENSQLTMKEAKDIYALIESGNLGADYNFLEDKRKRKEKLTQKDHDKLEYLNIVKTFDYYEKKGIGVKDLDLELILNLHNQLTLGLDIFNDYIGDFEPYKSGKLRSDNNTRVKKYVPCPEDEIKENILELISWLKQNPSIINIFIFHILFYAIHPFKNGNKRVSRMLEHFLLKDLGYNRKGLYSTSYYYHKEKERYYKYLIESLYKRDVSYFTTFASEAMYYSICFVIVKVLKKKKMDFIKQSSLEKEVIKIIKPLITRRQANFTKLIQLNKRKVSRQTLSNYLQIALEAQILDKKKIGRNSYYSIKEKYKEQDILQNYLHKVKEKSFFIPNDLISYL